jgi:hypothetical protein
LELRSGPSLPIMALNGWLFGLTLGIIIGLLLILGGLILDWLDTLELLTLTTGDYFFILDWVPFI